MGYNLYNVRNILTAYRNLLEEKQMKRIFALMLALLLAFSLVACSGDENEDGSGVDLAVTDSDMVYQAGGEYQDSYYYEYINGDEVAIISFAGSYKAHNISIPATIDDRPVTAIAEGAFRSMTNITGVVIPEGVTSIEKLAFSGCTTLKTVSLPSTLTSIGEAAFESCILLSTVTVPASVTKLESKVFYNCKSLTTASLPTAIENIPAQTFMSCERLTTVTWSASGKTVGDYAFFGCKALTGFSFPETLTKIGDYAFTNCAKQATPTLAGTVEVGENAFFVEG